MLIKEIIIIGYDYYFDKETIKRHFTLKEDHVLNKINNYEKG